MVFWAIETPRDAPSSMRVHMRLLTARTCREKGLVRVREGADRAHTPSVQVRPCARAYSACERHVHLHALNVAACVREPASVGRGRMIAVTRTLACICPCPWHMHMHMSMHMSMSMAHAHAHVVHVHRCAAHAPLACTCAARMPIYRVHAHSTAAP